MDSNITAKILMNLSLANKVALFLMCRGEILFPTQMELVGFDSARFCIEYMHRVATKKTLKLIERRCEIWEEFLAKFRTVNPRRTFLSVNLTFNMGETSTLHFWFNPLDDEAHLVCVERERTWEPHHNPIILDADSRRLYAYGGGGWRKDPRSLSASQMDVAALMAKGLSNRDIAEVLNVSEATVAFHKRAIFEKLGAASSGEALHILRALTVPPMESVGVLANFACAL